MEHNARPLGLLDWLSRAGILVLFIIALVGSLDSIWATATGQARNAEVALGFIGDRSKTPEIRFLSVAQVDRAGPLARAGIMPGDAVRFPGLFGQVAAPRPGERVPLEVLSGGKRYRTSVVARAPSAVELRAKTFDLLNEVTVLIVALLSGVLLVCGWRNRAALLLSAMLLTFFLPIPTVLVPPGIVAAICILVVPLGLAIAVLQPLFCYAISGGPRDAIAARCVMTISWLTYFASIYWIVANFVPAPLALPGGMTAFIVAISVVNELASLSILAINYRRSDAISRNRIKIVGVSFACLLLGGTSAAVAGALSTTTERLEGLQLLLIVARTFFNLASVALLAYAVLKQRLFDFGFAINRTLVYGAVSFTLLAAFGLAEWGADRLVPESWHRQSALYSAGIALLLFLSFHRVRDWFERHVERLFFAGWQRAQADLKRFVASAGHFRQAPALCREFAAEVERFAQGAPAALYLREDGGGFARQCGSLDSAASYTDEERAFALLAAEREPVDLAEAHSALPGAMAFPMLDQLGLAGFLLVGPRPDGAHYRPDEIDNLAWVTQQVGLDLQALQARELRTEVATLREQLAGRRRRPPKLAAVSSSATA